MGRCPGEKLRFQYEQPSKNAFPTTHGDKNAANHLEQNNTCEG